MICTSLSLSFLLSPAAAPASPLDLIPRDAAVVIEIGNIGALAALPEEERGGWLAVLMDPRLIESIGAANGADHEEIEDVTGVLSGFAEAASKVRGGAAAVLDPDEGMIMVLDVDEGFEEALLRAMDTAESTSSTFEYGQWTIHMAGDDPARADGGFAVADGRAYASVGDQEFAMDLLREFLDGIDTGAEEAPEPGWWEEADRGGMDATIAAHFNLNALPLDAEFMPFTEYVADTAYLAVDLESSSGGGFAFSMSLVGGEISDMFADVLGGEANADLLLAAPEGATVAQVVNIDILALIQAVLALVEEVEPGADAVGSYETMMESARATIGLDLEEDLLGNLTGDMFFFQWIDDMAGLIAEDEAAALDAFPIVGLGLEDEEPFIELLEMAEPFIADVGGEIFDSDDAISLVLDTEEFEMTARVGNGYLMLSANSSRLDEVVSRLGQGQFDGMVDKDTYAAITENSLGAGVALMNVGQFFEVMAVAALEGEESEGELAWFDDMLDVMEEHIDGHFISEMWMSTTSFGSRTMTR